MFENKEVVEWLKAGVESGDGRFEGVLYRFADYPAVLEQKEVVKWVVSKLKSSFSLPPDRFDEVIKIVGVAEKVNDGFRKVIINHSSRICCAKQRGR
ncbi:hypothetical protein SAMN02745225_02314 [Ferrithrix thermotolerans DSM 19514]|uniref:Uncharacterized protein n=1 Tax=Ferrithrix thermotolerans DSM 19514 TaxID=1121881 RepID=A0A1M4YEA2_9ACTN|nr:hypothetical protein [Ferrithrix thermotolerans]SHF03923.1 hypothetical protein SAMN02745225_02314 [Ferrithrix thermotolerans DSM 19514]